MSKFGRYSTIVQITVIVLETVAEAGDLGAPSGPMYLALNSKGLTLETYLIYMSSLVRLGLLTQGGDCYRITDKGRDYIRKALSTTEMASDKV